MKVNDRLEQDYQVCETIIKRYSKSFYYAFSNLPEQNAKAVYAIYAFCRKADDLVDETSETDKQIENLDNFSKELDAFCEGNIPNTPMWRALYDTCERYNIDHALFYLQLNGQRMDVHFEQPRTLSALAKYSKYVAGSVGQLLAPILCQHVNSERLYHAQQLGVAMQYTNILRDIGEDYLDYGRVYIPKEILKKYDYSLEKLDKNIIDRSFVNMWESVAKEAEQLYDNFLPELKYYDAGVRKPLLMSMQIYREILNEIRRNNYNCLTRRQAVSSRRKIKIKNDVEMFLNQQSLG